MENSFSVSTDQSARAGARLPFMDMLSKENSPPLGTMTSTVHFSPLLPWNTHFDFSTSPGEWAKVLSFLDCRILPFLFLKRTIGPERVFFKFLYAKSTSKTLKSEVENANARAEEFFGARQTSDDSPKITLELSRVAAAFLPAHSQFAPDSKSSMRICFC